MTTDHRPYIDDVVLDLSMLNITVTERELADTPVRSASLTATCSVTYRATQVVFGWTEETGWQVTLGEQPAAPLLDTVLPRGGALARAVIELILGDTPRRDAIPPYRHVGDNDDFEAQLKARHPKPYEPENITDPRLDRLDELLDTLLTAYTQAADGGPLPTPADAQQTAADVRAALADVHTMREQLLRARYLSAGNAWAAGQRSGRRAANRRY
ncbi:MULTISPECIES: hypothetical protein [unclassified Streptomyces]|uniref:hypothetical protein n=1 Tax=unclassified Streptomyces TaxID=2593676 RepID=UPI00381BBA95